jgi:hypothetical protein
MNDQVPETPLVATSPSTAQTAGSSPDSGAMIAITAIIALAIVSSCCILSCAIVAFAFFAYAPW